MKTSIASTIRKSLSGLVFVAGALATSAHAQAVAHQVRVDIPFAFQDGTAHLGPGTYTISLNNGNIMLVRGSYGGQSAMSMVNTAEASAPAAVGKVVFHKYGDRYFLRAVWTAGSSLGLECPKTRAEKDLQRELQLAANHPSPDGTEVALLELPH